MFGFIVAGCLREETHYTSLYNCLQSIEQFHPTEKCVVVMDFTSISTLVNKIVEQFPNVIFELDTAHYPADMQLLKYFKKRHYFDTAILLQDSMRVTKRFHIEKIKDIQYLWHFNNHREQWTLIKEPDTDYNRTHNIVTHNDLILNVISSLPESGFKEYCKEIYPQKQLWSGCFGCCCIMTYEFLNKLDAKTDIITLESFMITNRLRRVIESLFALACEYTLGNHIISSFDGLYYDGVIHNNMIGTHIHKVSFDRQ